MFREKHTGIHLEQINGRKEFNKDIHASHRTPDASMSREREKTESEKAKKSRKSLMGFRGIRAGDNASYVGFEPTLR